MFTQTSPRGFARRVLRSPLVSVLTGPHGVDAYTELVDRAWTDREARATIVTARRTTPRSVTLTLRPNAPCARVYSEFRAGGHVSVSVEIDGRRHTRTYSPANAEGSDLIELTESTDPDTTTLVVLLENTWARQIAAAVGDANAVVRSVTRFPAEVVNEVAALAGDD